MNQTLNGRGAVSITPHVADVVLTAGDNGTCHTNAGAAGTVRVTLPPATPGMSMYMAVAAAQALYVDPSGTEVIALPSTGVPGAAGKYLTSSTIGASLRIVCVVAGVWNVFGYSAAWTAEP